MLNTLVNATEKSLPTLIREHVRQDFNCIYDDKNAQGDSPLDSLSYFIVYSSRINRSEYLY